MSITNYLKEIKHFPILSKIEEHDVIVKAKNGDKVAYDLLITSNLKFVVSIAKQYQNFGLELEDLIAEGNLGLIKAFERFDITKKFKFITYAVWWIRQSIMAAIHENSRLIRLPVNIINDISKLNKLKDDFEQKQADTLSYSEFACMIENDDLVDNIQYQYNIVDIDAPVTENDKTLKEVIIDFNIEEKEYEELRNENLLELISNLPEEEQLLLKLYYGIGYLRPHNLEEIGDMMNLTRERIRQKKEKILKKIRTMKKNV